MINTYASDKDVESNMIVSIKGDVENNMIVSTSELFHSQLYNLYSNGKINIEKWLDAAKEYDLSHEYILTGKNDSTACTHLTLDQLNRDGQLSNEEYGSLLSKYECVPKEPVLSSQTDFL
jgi:hypothetical protein